MDLQQIIAANPGLSQALQSNPGLLNALFGHGQLQNPESGNTSGTSEQSQEIPPLCQAAEVGDESQFNNVTKEELAVSDSRGRTPLHIASNGGFYGLVTRLLELGADISAKDARGWSPLHHAASNGWRDIVGLLLRSGADPNASADMGVRPLLVSAPSVIPELIDSGAEIDAPADNGETALLHHATQDDMESVDALLGAGASPLSVSNGLGIIHLCCTKTAHNVLQSLLDRHTELGIDLNSTYEPKLLTALMVASSQADNEAVRMLLGAGADPAVEDCDGWTAAHFAASSGSTDSLMALSSAGCDLAKVDRRGITPLHLALANKHVNTASWLIPKVPHNTTDENGVGPYLVALQAGFTDIAEQLVQDGVDLCSEIKGRRVTPLMMAASRNSAHIIELALAQGADPNVLDKDGFTALMLACMNNSRDAARALLADNRTNVSLCNNEEKWTALHLAASRDRPEFVPLLIRKGIDIDARDAKDMTPLMIAASRGNDRTVQALLSAGANVLLADSDGAIALHIAASKRHVGSTRLLARSDTVDVKDNDGWTALFYAIESDPSQLPSVGGRDGAAILAEVLLDAGANPNIRCRRTQLTPLHLAARQDNAQLVKVLLQAGADPNATDGEGSTALHLAAFRDCGASAEELVKGGSKLDSVNSDGLTAIQLAVFRKSPKAIRVLAPASGIDVSSPSSDDDTCEVPSDPEAAAAITGDELARMARAVLRDAPESEQEKQPQNIPMGGSPCNISQNPFSVFPVQLQTCGLN